jgi:hypothetical protein
VGFLLGIGCWGPRSQKRDLGHPSIVDDAANGVIAPLTRFSESAARDDKEKVAYPAHVCFWEGGDHVPHLAAVQRFSNCSM